MKRLIEELSYQLLDHIQLSTYHLQIHGRGLGRELSDYLAKEIYRKLTEEYGDNLNEVKSATIDRIIVGDVEDSYSYPLGYSVKSGKLRIYLNVEYTVSRFFVFWRTYETTIGIDVDGDALDFEAKQKEYLGNVVHTTIWRKSDTSYNETERNLTKLVDYIIVRLRHLTDPHTYEQLLTKHNLRYLVPLVLRSTLPAETSTEYLRAWRAVYVNTYTFREYPEPFVIDLRERLSENIRFTSEDTPHDSTLPLINRFYDDRDTYDFRRAVVEALGSDTVAKVDEYLISDIEATGAMLERSPTMFSAVFNGLMSEDFVREYVL